MRTLSRAQHVVSTLICRCSHSSDVGGDFGVKQGELFAGQALQPAHEPYRHIGIPPAQQWCLPSPSGFSPSCGELRYRNAGARSLSSVATGNQVLALTLALPPFELAAGITGCFLPSEYQRLFDSTRDLR
jgi:hypothetical protein